ncbi:hypothetical protein ACFQZ4_47925 [Catellatospora coxensis]
MRAVVALHSPTADRASSPRPRQDWPRPSTTTSPPYGPPRSPWPAGTSGTA